MLTKPANAQAHYDTRRKTGNHHNAAPPDLANKLLGKPLQCLHPHQPWNETTASQTTTPDIATTARPAPS